MYKPSGDRNPFLIQVYMHKGKSLYNYIYLCVPRLPSPNGQFSSMYCDTSTHSTSLDIMFPWKADESVMHINPSLSTIFNISSYSSYSRDFSWQQKDLTVFSISKHFAHLHQESVWGAKQSLLQIHHYTHPLHFTNLHYMWFNNSFVFYKIT